MVRLSEGNRHWIPSIDRVVLHRQCMGLGFTYLHRFKPDVKSSKDVMHGVPKGYHVP